MNKLIWLLAALLLMVIPGAAKGAPPRTTLSLSIGRNVAPGPKIRINLNTMNIPTVQLTAYKMDSQRWFTPQNLNWYNTVEGNYWDQNKNLLRLKLLSPKPVARWSVALRPPNEKPNPQQPDRYRSRQVNLPALPPGVYLLIASGSGKEKWAVVNITNLAIIVKSAPHSSLVWVTDHKTGKPVAGASVRLLTTGEKGMRASTQTHADGTCRLPITPDPRNYDTWLVERYGTPGDTAAVPVREMDRESRLKAHLQTDRPVYRPGQTVSYRAILRRESGRNYTVLAGVPVTVEVRDSKDQVFQSTMLRTNAMGTIHGQVELSPEGALGAYSIVLKSDAGTTYDTFEVTEYRKPEFKVTATPAKKRYLAGEKAVFSVQTNYYFGAALPQAEVRYQVRRVPSPYYGASDEREQWYSGGDGNLYPQDTYNTNPFVTEGSTFTDTAGRANIEVATDPKQPDSTYTITCTVSDAQRRQVVESASTPVYAAALRLGMRTDVLTAPLGTLIPLQLRAADLDGKPAAARVTLSLRHQVWLKKEQKYVEKELTHSQVTVPASGKANATLPAAAEGNLFIIATATDATGRKTTATLVVWVADPNAKPEKEEEEPTVALRLDHRVYKPGDTAHIYATTNTPTRPMLLTLEGDDIFDSIVVPAGKRGFLWKVKTSLALSPNVHVTAAQWARPARLVSGEVILPVPDVSRHLDIRVVPDKKAYRPGETGTYTVTTRDDTGKSVPAEVALGVVDEAIYAVRPDISPDPYAFFWGLRANKTRTSESAPEELSGGAYQGGSGTGNAIAPVREQFLDTALWVATVQTNAAGTARVQVPFPGNLTTWRATAIGVTSGTQVGRAVSSVQVARPVLLRLAPPRLMVQNDHLTLIGTLSNRTNQPRTLEASLAVENLTLEDTAPNSQSVRVPANGEAKVEWHIVASTLPPDGKAKIEGTLIAKDIAPGESLGDISDRLRISVPIVPGGIAERITSGGVMTGDRTLTLNLPDDRLEPATVATVSVQSGLDEVAQNIANSILASRPDTTTMATDQLLVLATRGNLTNKEKTLVRDDLAYLSRTQKYDGWGFWENAPPDPVATVQVLNTLLEVEKAKLSDMVTPLYLRNFAATRVGQQYGRTELWEYRALIVAALLRFGTQNAEPGYIKEGERFLAEVERRGMEYLSPYAQLEIADTYTLLKQPDKSVALRREVLASAVIGTDTAFVPAGEHPGWRATTVQTTARALEILLTTDTDADLQRKFAQYLARPDSDGYDFRSESDNAAAAVALLKYTRKHPASPVPTAVILTVNGTVVPLNPGNSRVSIPRDLLKSGENTLVFHTKGSSELFISAEAKVYRPVTAESSTGMRVLRRFETQDAFGNWREVKAAGMVRAAAPVRVTVVALPDDQAEAIRIVQPIPAGFEFVDSELPSFAREEVRDGAVVDYLKADGKPITFRSYLRAESEGRLSALPATGEVLQRPTAQGNSTLQPLTVTEKAVKR